MSGLSVTDGQRGEERGGFRVGKRAWSASERPTITLGKQDRPRPGRVVRGGICFV